MKKSIRESIRGQAGGTEGGQAGGTVSRKKFARIPLEILSDSNLSMAAKLTYCAMASGAYYAGTLSMGVRLIATTCALSKTSVLAAIAELCAAGYVTRWDSRPGERQKYLLVSDIFRGRQGKENIVIQGENTPRLASVMKKTASGVS